MSMVYNFLYLDSPALIVMSEGFMYYERAGDTLG